MPETENPVPSGLRLQILGPLRVRRGETEVDAGARQQQCLLAVFLAREGRPLGMAELIGALWGDDAPGSAINAIHKYVGALRRLLEPGLPARAAGSYLLRQGGGYRFAADASTLDLIAFRALVAAAKGDVAAGRPGDGLDRYTEALGLWRGPAGDTLADTAAATATFAGLDSEFFDAVVAAAGVAIELRQPARMLAPLRLAAMMGRLNEPVHANLMIVLAAAGHQADALDAYRAIRDRLSGELGLDPGPELREAHRRVLTQTTMPVLEFDHQDSESLEPRPVPEAIRPAQLPPDQPMFTGRGVELATLRQLFGKLRATGRTGPLVVAMDGMGGVGKSTLAVHFARQVADAFDDGQLYLDLQGQDTDDTLVTLLYGLGLSAPAVPGTYDARLGRYRTLTTGKRILLLLDNARDAQQVSPLLPSSAASLVLVTSRSPLIELAAYDGAYLLRVDTPDPASARDLFRRRLASAPNRAADRDLADAAAIETILTCCGRLPLALAILAARLSARPGLTLADVAAELSDGDSKLDAFPRGEPGDPRNSFIWSYQQLSPGAARMFRLFAAPMATSIPAGACAALAGQTAAATRAHLDELTRVAMVIEDSRGRYSAHILVKAYAEELSQVFDPETDREEAISRFLQYYLWSSMYAQAALRPDVVPATLPPPLPGVVPERPGDSGEAMRWFAAEHEVLRDAVRYAAELGYGIMPWHLALSMQPYLEGGGFFHDWEEVMRMALRAARQANDRVGEAHALRGLAGAREAFGDWDEARELLHAAAELGPG